MIELLLDILFVSLLTLWCLRLGQAVSRIVFDVQTKGLEAFALFVPLGFGFLGLASAGLGLLGALARPGVVAIFCCGIGIVVYEYLNRKTSLIDQFDPDEIAPEVERPSIGPWRSISVLDGLMLALSIGVIASTFTGALAPVTDGDALCYHLQVPKVFLEARGMVYDADLHETVYPLLVEMLYSLALLFRGPVTCRLVHWVLGLAFAAGVAALGQAIVGRRARWAGVIALLVPAISNGMSAPLNDVALAAYCGAGLLASVRWWGACSMRSAAYAGAVLGLALGVKYPALVWVSLLVLCLAGCLGISALRAKRFVDKAASRRRQAQLLVLMVVCTAVGGIWYLRAYAFTGNPVHPFFKHAFGGSGLDEVLEPAKRPLALTSWNLATALWPVTLDPERFDSVSHQFGPAFLMLLPVVVLMRAPKRVVAVVIFGMLFFFCCMTQRQSMRFLLPAIAPWSVGAAWGLDRLLRAPDRAARSAAALVLMLLGFESCIAIVRTRHALPVLLGRETAADYLSRTEPTFVVGQWMEHNLPRNSRIVGQDHRGFYLTRAYTMELAHRRRTGLGASNEPADEVVATLSQRGFTHVLLCPPVPENAVEFDPTLSRILIGWTSKRAPLFERDLIDGDGVTRHYALYELSAKTELSGRERARR
jgi:hypothetical protein